MADVNLEEAGTALDRPVSVHPFGHDFHLTTPVRPSDVLAALDDEQRNALATDLFAAAREFGGVVHNVTGFRRVVDLLCDARRRETPDA